MALYKYVTAGTAERILKGSIRLTQPGAFNDPFELLPQFITPKSLVERNQQFSFCLVSPRRKGLDRSRSSEGDANRSDVQARKIVGSLNQSIGILCLSRNAESLLMWGHYADNYAGAVIEFDETHDFFRGSNPVKYQKHRPVFDILDFFDCPIPISDLCVKSNVWAYEKEVRIVRPISECKATGSSQMNHPIMTMDIPIDCIKGVVMGERMSVLNQRSIWTLVKDTHVSLGLAAVANWDYAFRSEPIKFSGTRNSMSPIISPRTAHIFSEQLGDLGDVARWTIENHPLSEFVNLPC